jgi:hypothetical protein
MARAAKGAHPIAGIRPEWVLLPDT